MIHYATALLYGKTGSVRKDPASCLYGNFIPGAEPKSFPGVRQAIVMSLSR
jgi:hypothetical protein